MGLLESDGRGCRLFRRDALSKDPPVIVIHSLAHALAALNAAAEAGRPIVLASAPDAGIYAGPGWFRKIMEAARQAVPEARFTAILDCGADAGGAMAAIRAGVEAIVFINRPDVAVRLRDIAAQTGARLLTARPTATLDLGLSLFVDDEELRRRCADALASKAAFC